jgi:diguanylate cyclase (GGDEF)-like protein
VLFSLIFLFLAHRAVEFFSTGHPVSVGPGRIALEAVAFLLPINLMVLCMSRERGVQLPVIASRLGSLFLQSVFVAVICRPGSSKGPAFLRIQLLNPNWSHWTPIPQLSLVLLLVAVIASLIRFLRHHKPVDAGFFWVLLAVFAAIQAGSVGKSATAYWATAALVLLSSIIETSYTIAYHDELTSLPGRRAFNDALLRLEKPYAIAAVDIDHFKSVNDTYGHDVGDEVLRMVAGRLARVTGGGTAYRVGGEEFTILFPGKSANELTGELEQLRVAIENSAFRFRGAQERRSAPRGPDRRTTARKRKGTAPRDVRRDGLSVTVSIGVAGPGQQTTQTEEVIQAADRALYRAKRSGRNRIEQAGNVRVKAKRSIA